MIQLVDLREMGAVEPYLTQCKACGFKGYVMAGQPDSVCPSCGNAVYAIPKPNIAIAEIDRAVNHQDDAIAQYSANPFTSRKKIENGMIVSALQSLPVDSSPEHRRDTIQYALKQAREIIRRKNIEQ